MPSVLFIGNPAIGKLEAPADYSHQQSTCCLINFGRMLTDNHSITNDECKRHPKRVNIHLMHIDPAFFISFYISCLRAKKTELPLQLKPYLVFNRILSIILLEDFY